MHEAINHAELATLFRKEFQLCNVQKGETILLLSDLGARRDYVSAAFAAAEDLGADAYEMCVNAMPSWTKVGVETVGRCKGTLDAIKSADMLVCLHIPLFTRSLKEARDAGMRHHDVPMRDCTVALDNDVIIDRGRFADEKMRVVRVPV